MGIEPFLIASTTRAVLAQRLVRHVCKECRVEYKPDAQELEEIEKMFGLDSPEQYKKLNELEQVALSEGIGSTDSSPSTDGKQILRLWKAKEGGCSACGGAGYKSRFGIYEVLENTSEIQRMIMANEVSSAIESAAVNTGMVTMQLDGLVKSLRGLTTIAEVLRVTRE